MPTRNRGLTGGIRLTMLMLGMALERAGWRGDGSVMTAASAASAGKRLRMRRLFHPKSGRAMVVAMDHGILGTPEGLQDLVGTVRELMAAGPDGILLNARMVRHCAGLWSRRSDPAVLLALDVFLTTSLPGRPGGGEEHVLHTTPKEAVALGADAVKVILAFGRRDLRVHARNLELVSRTLAEAEEVGLPVMVEATLWGELVEPRDQTDPGLVRDVARIAVELGADMLKLPVCEDPTALRKIVEATPVPVLVLGGARTESEAAVYEMARRALDAGVAGLVFGRNVWQHPDPRRLLARLVELVHTE